MKASRKDEEEVDLSSKEQLRSREIPCGLLASMLRTCGSVSEEE